MGKTKVAAPKAKPAPTVAVESKLMWRVPELAVMLSVSRRTLDRRVQTCWGQHPEHRGDPHHGAFTHKGATIFMHRDEVGAAVAYAAEVRRAVGEVAA